MAKGFTQKLGVFFETFSPVANMNLICAVLAVVVAEGYLTEQLDADTAFSTMTWRSLFTWSFTLFC